MPALMNFLHGRGSFQMLAVLLSITLFLALLACPSPFLSSERQWDLWAVFPGLNMPSLSLFGTMTLAFLTISGYPLWFGFSYGF
jgi:hypothetical protein